jgi:hypothetical protein
MPRGTGPNPGIKGKEYLVTLDATYVTAGGWPITAANFGLNTIVLLMLPGFNGGYGFSWDAVNSKLLAYKASAGTGAFTECATNEANLNGLALVCLAYGW